VKGCSMYVTHYPCNKCAQMIAQSNIDTVIYCNEYGKDQDKLASELILESAGVTCRQYDGPTSINVQVPDY
jgi:dCMP deaminase